MINLEEAKELVAWGKKNGLITKAAPANYSIRSIKRQQNDEAEKEKVEMALKMYEEVLAKIKNGEKPK